MTVGPVQVIQSAFTSTAPTSQKFNAELENFWNLNFDSLSNCYSYMYWAGNNLKASKLAFKNYKTRIRYLIFVNKILKAISFKIFAISERSKFWKQIAGKILKANRWKNFESFLKANRWKNSWKLIAGTFLKAKELAKFWKQIAGKCLIAFWKQIAGKFLKAKRWQNFESSGILFFASRERLPFRTPGSVPLFWDLLMLQLLRPNSSNLPCLYSTFNLEYPLVLSRFCLQWLRYA